MRIIVHAGQAHRDDFMAAALIVAASGSSEVEILRRDPTPEDLDDPDTWVVDVGGVYDPARRNFDHHQNRELPCSLFLVARHIGINVESLPWAEATNVLDTRGPVQYFRFLGATAPLGDGVWSPIEDTIIGLFSSQKRVSDEFVSLLREVGDDVIRQADEFSRQEQLFLAAEVKEVKGLKVLMWPESGKEHVGALRAKHNPEIAVSVSPDDRGPGLALYRFDDHPRVDFSVLDGHPDVLFAHKGGFIAKTKSKEVDALSLVEQAIK